MANELGGKKILLKKASASAAVTFTDAGDLVTLSAHGLSNGDDVQFSVITTTTGISINTTYYVVGATTNTFQVAATVGGAALALTTNGTGTIKAYYTLIGGLRTKSLSINSEAIDITNQDSGEWKKILDDAGIRSVSVSGAGVFEDGAVINALRVDMMANTLSNFRLYVTSDLDYFQGSFKITSLELAGEYNAEFTYSCSMESSGEVTYNLITA